MSKPSRLTIRSFPPNLRTALQQVCAAEASRSHRTVTISEVAVRLLNKKIQQLKIDSPEIFRAATYKPTREHDLVLDAIQQGQGDLEHITIYVNRMMPRHLNEDAVQFLLEDLLNAKKIKLVKTKEKAAGDKQNNAIPQIYVCI